MKNLMLVITQKTATFQKLIGTSPVKFNINYFIPPINPIPIKANEAFCINLKASISLLQ